MAGTVAWGVFRFDSGCKSPELEYGGPERGELRNVAKEFGHPLRFGHPWYAVPLASSLHCQHRDILPGENFVSFLKNENFPQNHPRTRSPHLQGVGVDPNVQSNSLNVE